MFGFLKEKIKSWTANLAKKAEETEEVVEEAKEENKKETGKKIKEKKIEKKIKKEDNKKGEKLTAKSKRAGKEIREEEGGQIGQSVTSEISKRPQIETPKEIIPIKKETPPEKEIQEPEKKVSLFSKLVSKVTKIKISDEDFDVYKEELEMLLLENNVALEVAEKITQELKEKIVGKEMLKKEIEGQIKESFKDVIYEILIEPFSLIEKVKNREDKSKPYVILFCGINGTGKTTSIAKIADSLKREKIPCVIAAADTFRAASIEQIKKHGEKIGITVIAHEYESDPASVGFDAIKYAEKNKIDCVLIDTAGRMHTAKNLMAQIEKIVRVCKPDLKIYVGESTTGNDAIEQVRSFNFAIGIDGIILSKADIDEKGGTALSVGYVTKRPILYLGTGQEYDKIEPFDKEKFIQRLGL